MIASRRLVAASTALSMAPAVLATPPDPSTDTVEITAEPIEESLSGELSTFGSRVEVISGEAIEKTGATDTAQALQMLIPGLYVAPENGRFDYVEASLRGSRTEDILWLVDGVRINNRLYGSTSPLDSIPAHMIERIEVVKGGQSLFYGTQALGGVVNIITRGFRTETDGRIGVGAGDLGDRHASAYVSGEIDGNRLVVFGSHDRSDGFQPYRDEHIEPSARPGGIDRGYRVTSLGGKYRREIGDGGRLTLETIHNDAVLDDADPTETHSAENDRTEDIVIAKWDQFVSPSFSFFLKGYYHRWDTEYSELRNTAIPGEVETVYDATPWGYEDYGLNAMGRWFLDDGGEVVFGADWQEYSGEDDVLLIETRTEAVGAVFAQYRPRLAFSPRTRLALGVRWNKADLGGENTVWNISARHPLGGGQYVRGTLGTSFRLPSAYQLYARDPDHPRGNENLDGEESLNADLGWGGATRVGSVGVSWELAAFGREIDDLIQFASGDGVSTYINSDDRVRMYGGEALLALQFAGGWHTSLNATYTRAREDGDDQQIDNVPEYLIKAGVGYDAPGGAYGTQLSTVYVGPTHDHVSDIGRERYGDHLLADVSGYLRFGSAHRHRLGVRVENITDEDYASTIGSAERDGSDEPYRVDNLGMPRNVQLTYSYVF
ncbi:TonB-dependent receptor plug domain-containing protein [Arhodomonas sp. AD133]|uniref:TonB-dependent receptor plug domain-containing protein n=1 Tax=Arhodomonas sp. AD133 TaxID=3415009 RepID=UPI003EBA5FB3